jgi:transcriptional regulator with GAF, ATPase, and Fis domain
MDAGQRVGAAGLGMTTVDTPLRGHSEERLRFEMLIADLSARFINVPADQVGAEIQHAQRRIVEALDLDRSSLWQLHEREPGALRLASVYEAGRPIVERASAELLSSRAWLSEEQSDKPPALLGMDARVFYPWACEQLLQGRTVAIASLDDLPAEAAVDKMTFRRSETKSTLVIPLLMGGAVIGAVTFAIIRAERAWPEPLVERFQLIARVFAEALTRSRADRELRASEARLALAAASAGARLWELEMRTGRLWITNTARRLYEVAPEEEMTFARFLEILHPEDRERVRDHVENRVQVGEDIRLEYRVLRPDGQIEWVAAWGHLHEGSAGDSDRLMGVSIDITDRKRMEEQLQARLREIEQLKQQLEQDNILLQDEVKQRFERGEIVTKSNAMQWVLSQVTQVAPTNSTVLISGETGVGKEVIARAIHELSKREGRPLVTVNCASLPPSLIEGELFGREKGAYTGALTLMKGRFESADGSTLFLDEIGELPLELQSKLLRVLEEGRLERLGSSKTIQVDVRVLAATNRDLPQEIQAGKFRKDLYYRLNVFPVAIPPLRERREDIPMLVWSFVHEFEKKMGKRIESVPRQIMEEFQRYSWPGNVRELRNIIEHAMIISNGTFLQAHIPAAHASASEPPQALADVERQHILSVLETTRWCISGAEGAAAKLGLKRSTLQFRMKKLGIKRPPRLSTR